MQKKFLFFLFSLATVSTVLLMGYYFGTFDQIVHIPFLKKFADPSLYPGDRFLDLRFQHYSYFWFFFIPLYKLGILEVSMFIVYLLVIFLTYWAIWNLSQTLFKDRLTSIITIIVFIFPHLTFAGFSVFQFSLLNRAFVLPFLLFAINLYLKRRYILSFLLLGLMYNFHVVSVNFVMAMFLFDSLLTIKRIGGKKFIFNIVTFIIAALPVLIWKMKGSPVEFTANWEWFNILNKSIMYLIFNLINLDPQMILLTLGGTSSIIIFFFAASRLAEVVFNNTVKNFVYALLIILIIALITTRFYPSTIIIQSQIIRAGLFILIFCYLYITRYIVKVYQTGSINRFGFVVFLLALILSPIPIILGITLFIFILIKPKYWVYLSLFSTSLLFIFILFLAVQLRIWRPGIYVFPEETPEYKVEIWAKQNTPKNALFITPPHRWWLYNPEWRAISERSTVVTLYDVLEIAFTPHYTDFWKERFEIVATGALKKFDGNVFASIETTKKAFYSNSSARFRQIAKTYGASYLLVEKPYIYEFPVVYENEGFILYDVRNP